MATGMFDWAVMKAAAQVRLDDLDVPRLAVGDRVDKPTHGIVVDLDADSVVVARRGATGRCMEVVFVGAAARTLRRN